MRLAGMKRSTRVFGDRVLRSRKRFNETIFEHQPKKNKKLLPVDVVDIQENNVNVVDYHFGLVAEFEGNRRYNRCRKVGNFNEINEGMGNIDKKERFVEKLDDNGDMEIDGQQEEVLKLGEFKDVSLVNEYVSRVKRLENVYTRKRKRNLGTDSSFKSSSSFDENCGSDKKYLKYYRKKKKIRVSLDTGSDGKDVTRKGPVVFASSSSSSGVNQFSCFVSSVLTYLRKAKVFSRRRFSSFLLLEPAASIYQSNGTRLLLDSTLSKTNGFFKVFGSIKSLPFFTMNFSSVPSCFLYMHSNLLLNFAFLSNAFSKLQIAENVTSDDINVPAIDTTRSFYHLDKCMVAKKPRSAVKRVPRASGVKGYSSRKVNVNDSSPRKAHVNDSSRRKALVNSYSQRKAPARERVPWVSRANNSSQRKTNALKRVTRLSRVGNTSERKEVVNDSSQRKVHVKDSTPVKALIDESFADKLRDIVEEGEVHVPVIKEVEGYEAVEYVPFFLPESYIGSKSDEVTRTPEKSYPVYDMDSDDEKWLKKFNSKHFEVSDEIFEKAIDAFERGIYCSPNDYSDAASAIVRCLDIASKGVLEGVYRYWMTKRKKKHSSRVRLGVFQCNKPYKVESVTRKTADRKRRSSSRLASKCSAEKQSVFKRAKVSDEKVLKDTKRAYINVHEAQEAARRSEEAAIAKRNEAQALMEIADLASYRATMALRIADALAAGGPVDNPAGDIFSFFG
ncbi:putative enhancer of polycomb protein [Tanacetum coccineum]